jgi:hypothetical protein
LIARKLHDRWLNASGKSQSQSRRHQPSSGLTIYLLILGIAHIGNAVAVSKTNTDNQIYS